MKKLLIFLLFLIAVGGVVYSIIQMNKNKELTLQLENSNQEISEYVAQIETLNTKIEGLSETVKVFATYNEPILSGTKLEMRYLQEIEVPKNAEITRQCLNSETIYDFIGMEFKTYTEPGSIIFKSMFRPSERYNQEIYEFTILPPSVPVGLKEGDMITVFMNIPGIPRIPVFAKEKVESIVGDAIIIHTSNEDLRIWDQIFEDCSIYKDVGVKWSIAKYVDDNDDVVAYYPVSEKYRDIINFDPNIKDKSRLLNKSVREYIEYSLYKLKHVGSKEEEQEVKDNQKIILPDMFTQEYSKYSSDTEKAVKNARDEVTKNGIQKAVESVEETQEVSVEGGLFD